MHMVEFLRRLRFEPKLIRLAKFLHVHKAIRRLYYKFVLIFGKEIRVNLLGYKAKFKAEDIAEISLIENSLIDEREGEIRVIENLLDEIKDCDIIYDIGASVGTHSVFMALKAASGKVFAFEPEDNSFNALKANILLNKLNNLIPFQVALGDSDKEGVISGGLGSFTLADNKLIPVAKTMIKQAHTFIIENGLPVPGIVKIDVEGYEYNVVKGLEGEFKNQRCRMVACELHPALLPERISADDVVNTLISYGFNKPKIYPRGETLHAFFKKE